MCLAIRFPCFEFSDHELLPLEKRRSGDEIRMLYRSPQPLLPVEVHGENRLVAWGASKGKGLPQTGFCKRESLEQGRWNWLQPIPVTILASSGWSKGVWFQVRQGIRGILVYDREEQAHCYMLTQPATHYFKTMTGAERMPVLIDQII